MRIPLFATLSLAILVFNGSLNAQHRKSLAPTKAKAAASQRSPEIGQTAVVMDETLSVLRASPSLFADSVQRMRRGRKVHIQGVKEADGVKFYRVAAPPTNFGWVQADAVFGKFRANDEERLAKLIQALDGFDQIETAVEFFKLYPNSKLRPSIMVLYGDLVEEEAARISKHANSNLKRAEMAASAAPMHSYYLNYVRLDRYRKLGITFIFNSAAKQFHYDGASWKETAAKFPTSPEAAEAKKRLDALAIKMEKPASATAAK